MTKQSRRGGLRNPSGGRPPLPPSQKRQKHTLVLAPETKQLAQDIAACSNYAGWGYAVDEAIKLLAEKIGIAID